MPWWFVLRLSICFLNTVVQKSLQMNFMISNSSLNLAVSFVNLKRSTFYQSLSHSKPHVFQFSYTASIFHLPLLRGLVHSRHHLVMQKQKQRLVRHFLLILPSSRFRLPFGSGLGILDSAPTAWTATRPAQSEARPSLLGDQESTQLPKGW